MGVDQAILAAERILPGEPVVEGSDPRWQAIIAVGEYILSDPAPVWEFARRWGSSEDEDVRDAIAGCLLEHLLEHHFGTIFPRLETEVRSNVLFADCFGRCWAFGQTTEPGNLQRFEALKNGVRPKEEGPE